MWVLTIIPRYDEGVRTLGFDELKDAQNRLLDLSNENRESLGQDYIDELVDNYFDETGTTTYYITELK